MQIKLKSMNLINYKGSGTHAFCAEFGNVTRISGRNKSGKSSIMDAYLDILTSKLADGSEPNSVRPHDENGNDLNRDDVVRELVFDIDGTETTVEKVTSQKWAKKRGTTEKVFEGNKTTYVIDGFESSNKKAFTEWQEKIAKADVLLMCSSARPFLNTVQKSTVEARKILENLAGFSTEKFIAESPKYAHIADITKNHKIEDALKQLRRDLSAQKKVVEEAKVKLDYERAREISVDGGIEIAELELLINGLKEKISELDKQETALDEAVKAYDEASSGILELEFGLSDLERKANEENNRKRREIEDKISDKKFLLSKTEKTIREIEQSIAETKNAIKNYSELLEKYREQYREEQERVFDENSLICPYCGNEYKEDKKVEIQVNFEDCRKGELNRIAEKGNDAKAGLEANKDMLMSLESELPEHKKSLEMLNTSIDGLEKQLSELPDNIGIFDTAEYKAIQSQIAEKEASLNAMNNHSEKRAEIKAERQRLLDEISDKKAVILKYRADTEEKERHIENLEVELKNKVQKQADIEKNIDELLSFSIEKNRALADAINPYFQNFHFCFYDTTQDGGIYETLKLINNEDGTSYYDGLNKGDRALIELHLCVGLQKMNNLQLPIWCDDVNDIDSDRIPKIEQQLILLERKDEKGLKVEILE